MWSARKTVTLVFVLTTVLFSASTAYSSYFYFQLYHAVRSFSVSVVSFSFYNTQSILMTDLNIQNPSEVQFEILYVQERIDQGYNYILNNEIDRQMNPLQFPPYGNLTLTMRATVPDTKMLEVTTGLGKSWQLAIFVRIRGPAVGEFTVERDFETQVRSL
jgi:hypothetical protein